MSEIQSAVLLYDGTCGFCARSVQFVLGAERADHSLQFSTLEGPLGRELRAQFPGESGVDSVLLFIPGTAGRESRILSRSDAALWVANYLGGRWRFMGLAARIAPRPLRNAIYDMVARHRHRIAGASQCLLPTAEQRARFL